MKWKKCGKILDHNTIDLDWFTTNAMMPLPYELDDKTFRIFLTMCDDNTVGRIGYIDVNRDNPKQILNYSERPIIDIGEPGTWDDNGVVTGSLLEYDNKLYMFYSGYQLCRKIPYMIFSGLAVSMDQGRSFSKLNKNIPLLDRINNEKNFRCVPNIVQQGNTFLMYYLADCLQQSAWIKNKKGKLQPVYTEKVMKSTNLFTWDGNGESVLEFENNDEHGLSIGSIWEEDQLIKCIYSVRSLTKGYRLGYAESRDGRKFIRKDNELNLDVTPGDFDSEMMCYAKRFLAGGNVYLFYSGNGYGRAGIGYALLDIKG